MPSREEALLLAKHLHALDGGPEVRRKAAARALGRLDPTDAPELIHHLLVLARSGQEPASCALSDVVAALGMEGAELPNAAQLKRLAAVQDLSTVAALFPEGPAVKEYHPGAAAKADAQLFSQSLGHLKTLARLTRNPDELSKLAVVSNPSVLRNVLINPRLTEELVVRIAARRPARPEPLVEIWRSPRWSSRHWVRRALVFNPYLPPDVGAKIVPLLPASDLEELSRDNGLHPALREQARMLLSTERAPDAAERGSAKPLA